jgi:hemerythrin-like domain-containing protein
MKRSAALSPLSRDHHHGLFAALKLTRADDGDAGAAAAAFLEFWRAEGRRHFQIEEDLLLPGFARHGAADHPAVVRALVEHVDLRRRAQDVERGDAPLDALHELGRRLSEHIRGEENVLFPLVEETLPADELDALGRAIEAAEHRAPAP